MSSFFSSSSGVLSSHDPKRVLTSFSLSPYGCCFRNGILTYPRSPVQSLDKSSREIDEVAKKLKKIRTGEEIVWCLGPWKWML